MVRLASTGPSGAQVASCTGAGHLALGGVCAGRSIHVCPGFRSLAEAAYAQGLLPHEAKMVYSCDDILDVTLHEQGETDDAVFGGSDPTVDEFDVQGAPLAWRVDRGQSPGRGDRLHRNRANRHRQI